MMTDFNMNMIAPGIIDHKEWTPDNGRNNASVLTVWVHRAHSILRYCAK